MYIFCSTYIYVHIFFSSFSVPFFYLCSSFLFLFSTPLWKKEKNYCVEERKKNLCYIHTNILFLICFSSFNASAPTALCVFLFFPPFFLFPPHLFVFLLWHVRGIRAAHFFFFFLFPFFPSSVCSAPFAGKRAAQFTARMHGMFFFPLFFCFVPWKKCCTYWSSYARNDFFFFFFFFLIFFLFSRARVLHMSGLVCTE